MITHRRCTVKERYLRLFSNLSPCPPPLKETNLTGRLRGVSTPLSSLPPHAKNTSPYYGEGDKGVPTKS